MFMTTKWRNNSSCLLFYTLFTRSVLSDLIVLVPTFGCLFRWSDNFNDICIRNSRLGSHMCYLVCIFRIFFLVSKSFSNLCNLAGRLPLILSDKKRASSISIRFFRLTDPTVGGSIYTYWHGPFFRIRPNWIRQIRLCERSFTNMFNWCNMCYLNIWKHALWMEERVQNLILFTRDAS